MTATLTADADLDLGLWKQGTVSVIERIIGDDRLAEARRAAREAHVQKHGRGPIRLSRRVSAKGSREATYSLRILLTG